MKENLKKGKMWQQSLEKYSKRLIIARNNAELCEVMEESYKLFLKLISNCSKHNKPKKASKIMLSLKRFIFLCKMSNEKFESSTEEQDSFASILSRYLSILIEISFTTGSLDDTKRCADITTFLVLHLGHSPEHLVDSILRVINVFKRCSQSYSLLYWKVWQLAEKNLTNPLYLKCLLWAKYWTRHLKSSEQKPYIKSAEGLVLDSISRKWINERLEDVGVSKIHKRKKMTKLILNSLKLSVRKALKKKFFGQHSKENASKPLQLIEAEVPSDKEEEESAPLFFIDRQGVSNVESKDANENDDENEETLSVNKNTDNKREKTSCLDQNQCDNFSVDTGEIFKSIEAEVETGSDEEVDEKATDSGNNNAESKIIANNHAIVDKHSVVNILEDLEVPSNASPESSSVKNGQNIESNCGKDKGDNLRNNTLSQQINEESNSESGDEDNLRNKTLSKQINEENNSETEESDNDEKNKLRKKSFSKQINEENNSETEESDNDEENKLRNKSFSKQIKKENNSETEESDNDEKNKLRNKSFSKQINEENNSETEESDNDEENNLRNKSFSKQINKENNSETEESDNDEENKLRNKSFSKQIKKENNSETEESDNDEKNKLRNKSFSKQINEENNSETEESDNDVENNLKNKSFSKQINKENNSETEESDNDEENNLRNKSFSKEIDEENNSEGEESDNDKENNFGDKESDNDEENNLRKKTISKQIDKENNSEAEEIDNDEENYLRNKSLSRPIGDKNNFESDNDEENNLRNETISKHVDEINNFNSDDDGSFKSIETEVESDEEVDEKATDNSGNNADSKIIANNHAIADKHSAVNVLEDLEVHSNAPPESSFGKKGQKIESNCTFSQQINEENNTEDEESEELKYWKRKKKSSPYKVRASSIKISPRTKSKVKSESKKLGKRVSKQTIELIETSDFNNESEESKDGPTIFNHNDENTELKEFVSDDDSSSTDEICKKLDFVEESILEISDDESDSEDNIQSKNEKTIAVTEVSDDELSNHKIKSPSVVIRRVSETFQDEEKDVSSPKKSAPPEPQSPITKTSSGLILGSLTRKSLRSHNSLLSKETDAIKSTINGLFSQTNADFSHFETESPQSISSILKNIPSLLKSGTLSPVKIMPSPKKMVNSPQLLAMSPNKDLVVTEERSILSPRKSLSATKKCKTPSPQKTSASPQKSEPSSPALRKSFVTPQKDQTQSPRNSILVSEEFKAASPQKTLASPQKSEPNSPAPRRSLVSLQKDQTQSPRNSISTSEEFKAASPQKTLASPQKSEPNSPAPRKSLVSPHKDQTQSPRNSISASEEFKAASPKKSLTSPQESKYNSPTSKKDQTLSPQKSLKRPLSENLSIKGSVQDLISESENEESAPKVARRTSKRVVTPVSSTRLRTRGSRIITVPRIEEVDECLDNVMSEDESAPKPTRSTSERVATPASTIRLRNRVSGIIPRIEEVDDTSESILSSQLKRKPAGPEFNKKIVEKTPTKKAPTRVQSTPTTATRLRSRRASALSEIEEGKEDEPVMPKKRMITTVATTETNIKEERARSVSPANVRYSKRLRSRDAQTVATSRIIPITRKQDPTSVVVLVKRLEEEYPRFVNNRYFIKPDIGSDSKVQKSGSVRRFNMDQSGNASPEVSTFDSPQTNNPNEIAGSSPNSSFTSEDFRNYHTIKTLPCAALETPKRRSTHFMLLGNEVKRISPKNDESDSKFFKSTPRSCKSVYGLRPK